MNSLHVMIDGYNLALEKGTGIATYARNLSYVLHDIGTRVDVLYGNPRPGTRQALLQEILFFDPIEPFFTRREIWLRRLAQFIQVATIPLGLRARRVPISGRVISKPFESRLPYYDCIWNVPNLFGLAHAYFYIYGRRLTVRVADQPSVAHWTYPVPIRIEGAKNIYTLHDLVPLRLPYTTLDKKKFYYRMVRYIVKHADGIVTVSENSKRDICDLLGVGPERVANTYQSVAIPRKYFDLDKSTLKEILKGTFDLDIGKYFLFVGAIEPKKNVGRLLEAYLSSGVKEPLVMAGPLAWKSEKELALLSSDRNKYLVQHGRETFSKYRVIRLDYVTFPQLVYLIRGARALLFPSLYEGFGLPILEAMTLGTSVMTANCGSMSEIAGDAAILVDPYQVGEMREAIKRLAVDENLVEELRHRGRVRARHFEQGRYKERLQQVYRKCATQFGKIGEEAPSPNRR